MGILCPCRAQKPDHPMLPDAGRKVVLRTDVCKNLTRPPTRFICSAVGEAVEGLQGIPSCMPLAHQRA